MSRLRLGLFALALFAAGCVPTTEPLTDVEKAEPDKNLVGEWKKAGGELASDMVIDIPVVKDNPKGLMRLLPNGGKSGEDAMWFFLSTIEKKTYANLMLNRTGMMDKSVDFSKEGEFAKWQKSDKRGYFLFQYTLSGDDLVVEYGSITEFEKLARAEKFELVNEYFFTTPKDWLAKYLTKNGSAGLYDGSNKATFKRVKK